MKIRVPDDISIVGFDDSQFARVSEVKLTTIRHPQSDMGMEAAKMILQLVDSQNKPLSENEIESIVYEPELIIRNSTKKL